MRNAGENAAWLALHAELPIEPDLRICDAHHHLWDRKDAYFARISPRYMLDEFLADIQGGHNVVSTLFCECAAMYKADGPKALRCIGETEFVNGLAAMSASGVFGKARVAAGIIGSADLQLGDGVAAVLDAQIAAGGGRFRGIRWGATWDASDDVPNFRTNPPPGLFLRQDFRGGFAHLAPRGLVFDAWCYHHQIPELVDLARAFPDTTIVLNHLGGPLGIGPYAGKADEVHALWRRNIDALAACQNVLCKLGGINMALNGFGWQEKPRPPSSEELTKATRHYYDYAIDRFGADRCMFESNFPVDKVSCSYVVLWNSFKRLVAGFSAREKAKLFHDNAARVYRIEYQNENGGGEA